MRGLLLFLCLGLIAFPVCAQTGKKSVSKTTASPVKKTAQPSKPPTNKKSTASQSKKPSKALDDKKELETASAIENPSEKIAALKKFIVAFPDSQLLNQAQELLSATAYVSADASFANGDVPAAIDLYKLAASSAPTPIPAALFNDSLSKIPNTLYWRGNRVEAVEIAKVLESRIGTDGDQFSALAMFYVGIENGDEAVRLADAAVKADPTKSKAYGVLGLAERVDFKLDESAAAYAKALELEPNSNSLKRNLAEIKRATGKADEAVALYKDAVAADASDLLSQNGLVLSLFDAGKTEDAEKALAASLDENPNNVMLIAGAAYWYAAHKMDEKAVTLARRAISVEPRYVWSHIALGRALMLQNRPVEAEEALLKARAYGNFPTLEYEIASARAMAGFYRDAVEGLEKAFTISGDEIETKIGGRVERESTSFTDALADERRASILEPSVADDDETAAELKALLQLRTALSAEKPNEAAVSKAADAFVAGDANSKYHRQLYASSLLLKNKIAVDKALEYAEAAVGNSDNALAIPNAGAFVMASELYDSRQLALTRSEFIKVPDVPKQTLAAILRGRIEDLIGWALVQQNKPADAEIHFKRAISILPDKSAWWRASLWRYGTALQAEGKEAEALDAYIKSYSIDKPDIDRYTTVEALYKKLNGNTEGLQDKIGPSPAPSTNVVAKNDSPSVPAALPAVTATPNIDQPQPTPTPTVSAAATTLPPSTKPVTQETAPENIIEIKADSAKVQPATVSTSTEPGPTIKAETTSTNPDTKSVTTTTPAPEATPAPTPTPTPEAKPAVADASPTPSPTMTPESTPAVSPTPEMTPRPTPEISPMPTSPAEPAAVKVEPSATPSPTPSTEAAPTPTPVSNTAREPVATPTPTLTPEPSPTTLQDTTTLKVEPSPSPEPTKAKAEASPTPLPQAPSEPAATPTSSPAMNAEQTSSATSPPGSGADVEPSAPKRVKTELVVSSTIPLPSPTSTPNDRAVAEFLKKPAAQKPPQVQPSSSPKPLFDPVVITVQKGDTAKTSDRPTLEIDRGSNDGRARLVDGQPVQAIEPPPCQITVSQEKLSLLNNGGTLAVLVGIEKGESLNELRFVVSDPEDISVKFEPDIDGLSGRSLYVITSTSEKTGNYRVTFYLPCGKKDVNVTVR